MGSGLSIYAALAVNYESTAKKKPRWAGLVNNIIKTEIYPALY